MTQFEGYQCVFAHWIDVYQATAVSKDRRRVNMHQILQVLCKFSNSLEQLVSGVQMVDTDVGVKICKTDQDANWS